MPTLIGEPLAQVRGKIMAKRQGIAFAVLLVRGVKRQESRFVVEVQLPDGERSQFYPAATRS